ncbi:unnamed protein product, partial [marine sediment metagenome]
EDKDNQDDSFKFFRTKRDSKSKKKIISRDDSFEFFDTKKISKEIRNIPDIDPSITFFRSERTIEPIFEVDDRNESFEFFPTIPHQPTFTLKEQDQTKTDSINEDEKLKKDDLNSKKDKKNDEILYKNGIIDSLNGFIAIINKNLNLNLDEKSKLEILNIFNDILKNIRSKDENSKFNIFYCNLDTVKSSKYTAGSLFFFYLHKNKVKITKKRLSTFLNLDRKSLTQNLQSLFRYLIYIDGYEFTYELFSSSTFDKNEY